MADENGVGKEPEPREHEAAVTLDRRVFSRRLRRALVETDPQVVHPLAVRLDLSDREDPDEAVRRVTDLLRQVSGGGEVRSDPDSAERLFTRMKAKQIYALAAAIGGLDEEAAPVVEVSMHEAGELENLDSTVIAVPLLREMKRSAPGDVHEVIIEINLMHESGRQKTREMAADLVRRVTGEPDREKNKKVHEDSDVDKYVFAKLTTAQIRELARRNETARRPEPAAAEPAAADAPLDIAGARESLIVRFEGEDGDVVPNAAQRLWKGRVIYKIWPDFEVDLLLTDSVGTVKADAAHTAFAADGRNVVWAVIDTGIDGSHRHFHTHDTLKLDKPLEHQDFSDYEPRPLGDEMPTDPHGHGTHVAGIIAGELGAEEVAERMPEAVKRNRNDEDSVFLERIELAHGIRGIAPRCQLVSLKVANDQGEIRARSILAALSYVRRINGDGRLPKIHGVNISLGHSFDPEWFACGQSPLCVEVDRLVRTGTVVVVAAGNGGFGTLKTEFIREMQAGLAGTIRDPANANLAITVGSTHRDMPHVYGVSYFSAKGPTGDGRLKPDLVAPGEKILSCAARSRREQTGDPAEYVEDSGTSAAAPHVSGCIAAFLSIRREFKNQPERVREIFLGTATDLGRERYYQGHGLVDLMRAIQSV